MTDILYAIDSQERRMAQKIAAVLNSHIGKKQAITNRELQEQFPELSERTIQSIVNHLRNTDSVLCLVASSQGYYVAETETELQDYEKSLNNRIRELVKVRDKVAQQRAKRFHKSYQANLF